MRSHRAETKLKKKSLSNLCEKHKQGERGVTQNEKKLPKKESLESQTLLYISEAVAAIGEAIALNQAWANYGLRAVFGLLNVLMQP